MRPNLEALRDLGPAGVLARAGCQPTRRKGRVGPCPMCGAPDVLVGRHVWTCFRCGASMDAPATAKALGGGTWEGAMAWAGVDSVPDGYRVPRVVPSSPPPPEYAPDAADLWHRCTSVTRSPEVSAWLESRGVDPVIVRRLDVARVLPRGPLPEWAEAWRPGWWCILPAWSADGRIVSLRARWVRGGDVRAKTRPPTGYAVSGTVLAGPAVPPLEGRVLVVEGEPAYLHAVTHVRGVQVVGVYAGCGGAAHWRRVAEAAVATDADAPGDAYAEKIAGWCPTVRMRPPEGMGWDDGWMAGWRGVG